MARTSLTVQECSRFTPLQDPTGNTPDVANGNSFDNSSTKVILIVKNDSAGNAVLTVHSQITADTDLTVGDRTYTIPATEEWVIGPFSSSYNTTDNSLTNRCLINFDVSTDITVKVIKVPSA